MGLSKEQIVQQVMERVGRAQPGSATTFEADLAEVKERIHQIFMCGPLGSRDTGDVLDLYRNPDGIYEL